MWRVVRAGRRSTTGNRVNGQNRFEGSNPLLSAKKDSNAFWYCYLFLVSSKVRDSNQKWERTPSVARKGATENHFPPDCNIKLSML